MYSVVCLSTEEELTSPLDLLKKLFEHFGVTETGYLEIYDKPVNDLGDYEELVERRKHALVNKSNLTPADALDLLSETKGVTALLGVEADNWGDPIGKEMREADPPFPDDLFLPWDVSFVIGPNELPDLLCEKVIGYSRFLINLGGDHSPSDPEEFLRKLRLLPRFRSLEDFINRSTGIPFLVSMYIT
jgi:hypothetical protein